MNDLVLASLMDRWLESLAIAAVLGVLPALIAYSKGRSFALWWLYGWMILIVAIPHSVLLSTRSSSTRANTSQGRTLRRIVVPIAVVVWLLPPASAVWLAVNGVDALLGRPEHALVEAAYPGYYVVDGTPTISGYRIQHRSHECLRLYVSYFRTGDGPARDEQPSEQITRDWATDETFFLHADGGEQDPRTQMTYDIEGFAAAYAPLRPGPNSLVCGVWLDRVEERTEYYVVLVSRNDPEVYVWPDHRATFTRDVETGEWTGSSFEPAETPN